MVKKGEGLKSSENFDKIDKLIFKEDVRKERE